MRLPLFPDCLDRCDPFRRQADHVRTGHGVWSLGQSLVRRSSEDSSETCYLVVAYDDQRFRFEADKDGKPWTVEIGHYTNTFEHVPSGWGSSRSVKRRVRQQFRCVQKTFVSRDSATEFAEKVISIFDRVREQSEAEVVA